VIGLFHARSRASLTPPLSASGRGTDLPVLLPVAMPAPHQGELSLTARLFTPKVAFGLALALTLSIGLAEAQAQGTATPRESVIAIMLKWAPLIFQGFLFNILVSFMSMAIGTVAGTLLGLAQVSLLRPVRRSSWYVTQFFRNAPWLVLLFYCMFLLPFELRLFGITIPLPAWFKAVIGLSLPVMANVAEVVRGGIQSIPLTQWESAEALAFNRRQTLWMIILPQCVKRMLPPWMNLYAILTMATTLISVVGIQDGMTVTRAALVAESRVDLFIPMYLMLLSWFFLYCYPIARWTVALEQRFAVKG
jgi:polar amino acid transport system permease protein